MQGKGCNTVRKVVTFQEMQSFREEKKKIQEGSANIFLFCRLKGRDESLWGFEGLALEKDANQGLVIAYKFPDAAAYDFSSCS